MRRLNGLVQQRLVQHAIADLLKARRSGNFRFGGNLPVTCSVHARRTPGRHSTSYRHPAVGLIKDYIDEHFSETVTLDTLSQVAGVSPFHALRLFRNAEGKTPGSYQLELRIRRACELLEQGMPIVETALETGFYDQSHFTNTFRRITGTTPSRYRKKRKILQEPEP